MENIVEFVGENVFWVSLWFGTLFLLLWNLFSDVILGISLLEPMDVTRRINHDDANIVDVRNPTEYEAGHILNSINIPDSEITKRKAELDKFRDKPLILYCQSGQIATRMVKILKADGFKDVSGLKGGIGSWQRASLPLTRDN